MCVCVARRLLSYALYVNITNLLYSQLAELELGKWFKKTGRCSDIFLATKFGASDPEGKVGDGKPISTPSYVKYALSRSLQRLGTDYIDLYYQHRVDPAVPIEAVLEALREPVEKGQVRWIGLSECSVRTLRRAKAVPGLGEKVVVAQMEFSPFSLDIEKDGFVQAAREMGVSVVAYSPLGRGMITGRWGPLASRRCGLLIANLVARIGFALMLTSIAATLDSTCPVSPRRTSRRILS